MNKSQCREMLTKEIRRFAGGRSLKKFKIEKKVQYNGKKYDNREGLKCDDDSGLWKMGTTIEPCEGGYVMVNWTIVSGKVTWNAKVHFNSKMTCQSSHINTFMRRRDGARAEWAAVVFNGNDTCSQYLGELLSEWGNCFMTEENGWIFNN